MEYLKQGQNYFSQNQQAIIYAGVTQKTSRLNALDLQRGLIMCLMAFSHCRDYVSSVPDKNLSWNNPLVEQGTNAVDFIQKTFVSLVAAGGFYMMMGIGIFLLWQARIKQGASPKAIRNYLLCRGMVLIFVQFTILALFEIASEKQFYLYFGVLFSLGTCMMAASLLMYWIEWLKSSQRFGSMPLEYGLPILIGTVIILISNWVIWGNHQVDAAPGIMQIALLLGGEYNTSVGFIDINFTPIPWFPSVAMGLVLGKLITTKHDKTWKILGFLSLAFLTSWFIIRTANIHHLFHFGDYKLFLAEPNSLSWTSYVSISKFPPSLTYFLWAWSINILGLVGWYKLEQIQPWLFSWFKPLKIFGQNALFFFIGHWFVYYGLSLTLSNKLNSIASILSIWLIGLIILFPLCKKWYQFKNQTDKDSLWRMF